MQFNVATAQSWKMNKNKPLKKNNSFYNAFAYRCLFYCAFVYWLHWLILALLVLQQKHKKFEVTSFQEHHSSE